MRATLERPATIAGVAVMFVVSAIVAIGLGAARLLEHTPDSHCPACGRTRTTCTCWGPHGVMVDG